MFDHNFVTEMDFDDGQSEIPSLHDPRLLKINFMRATLRAHQLLHYPEMTDPLSLESLLEAIETDNLQRYLPSPVKAGTPSVFIGRELGQSILNKMSIVSIAYDGHSCNGEIHILGPTRMPYEKIIGLAKFTAEKMETYINKKYMK